MSFAGRGMGHVAGKDGDNGAVVVEFAVATEYVVGFGLSVVDVVANAAAGIQRRMREHARFFRHFLRIVQYAPDGYGTVPFKLVLKGLRDLVVVSSNQFNVTPYTQLLVFPIISLDGFPCQYKIAIDCKTCF